MFSFGIPSPTTTTSSVTTARQSQHSSVMTSPTSFSSGNQIYHPASVQDEPNLHQWHSGEAERVTPHLYDATTEADIEMSRAAMQSRWNAQGISAYRPYKVHVILAQSQSDSFQARLGKEPDTSIATDFGVSKHVIQRRRRAQGIAAYRPYKSYLNLTKRQSDSVQARLGRESDAVIAADFGVSRTAIREHRRSQGIAAYRPHKLHVSLNKRQSDRVQARLGREPDAVIAADFGVSETMIKKRRLALGIAAYRTRKPYIRLTQSQSEHVQARLGKEPDASIAADFGISKAAIQSRRRTRGIAAYKSCKLPEQLTLSQSDSAQARLGKEPDVTTEAGVEESVETILRRWFEQGSTTYEPRKLCQLHQLQLPDIHETDK